MRKQKLQGFSLIELVVSLAIIGVLAALAIPAYQQHVIDSRRIEAQSTLLEIAGKQVRFHAENNTYVDKVGDLGYGAAGSNAYETESGTYEVKISASNARSFELTATPKGTQLEDACGSLTYNSAGVKQISSTTVDAKDCW